MAEIIQLPIKKKTPFDKLDDGIKNSLAENGIDENLEFYEFISGTLKILMKIGLVHYSDKGEPQFNPIDIISLSYLFEPDDIGTLVWIKRVESELGLKNITLDLIKINAKKIKEKLDKLNIKID